jgi:hypothetical protein
LGLGFDPARRTGAAGDGRAREPVLAGSAAGRWDVGFFAMILVY